jgi:mannose-6-phosphate isomerase-like protein (cupin superfamily)
MVKENIMDNIKQQFGRQHIPESSKALPIINKYWGSIQTIVANEDFTLKIVKMIKGTQSSMEYHVNKDEYYYIAKGKLKLGLRIGRAVNKSIILNAGDVYHIPPGLMHMRIALDDTEIIEWSNKDDDSDSNIVEDGQTYIFKENK